MEGRHSTRFCEESKLKLITRKAYGFRIQEACETASYHNLGARLDRKFTEEFFRRGFFLKAGEKTADVIAKRRGLPGFKRKPVAIQTCEHCRMDPAPLQAKNEQSEPRRGFWRCVGRYGPHDCWDAMLRASNHLRVCLCH